MSTTRTTRITTGRGTVARLVVDHPAGAVATLLVGLTWAAFAAAHVAGLPAEAALVAQLALFVAVPVAVSAVVGGRAEVRRLLAGLLRWRVGAGRWLLVLLALPALTVLVGLATGTYLTPADGWVGELTGYAVMSILVLGVTGNLVEEMAWGGAVQGRLMARHGVVVGSLITAVPFALIHLPQALVGYGPAGPVWSDVAVAWAVLVVIAPAMRLLLGVTFAGTSGSILAIGLMHASFNGAGRMSVVGEWWQPLLALVVLAIAVTAGHLRGRRRRATAHRPATA